MNSLIRSLFAVKGSTSIANVTNLNGFMMKTLWYSKKVAGSKGIGARGQSSLSNEELNQMVEEYSKRKVRPLSIADLIETARESNQKDEKAILTSAQFLQDELPVRLAHLLKDMQSLPFIVGMNPYVRTVYSLYKNSFEELARFPKITTIEQENLYTQTLKRLVEDHKDVIPILSKGMIECKKYIPDNVVKEFLDRKIRDRIGIRVLAEQHIAIHQTESSSYAGVINTNLKPAQLIKEVGQSAQELCNLNYGIHPEIVLSGATEAQFPYIRVHMEYIVFELLKNSMRATVEWSEMNNRKELRPIEVTIGVGKNDLTIRFSDYGGGVPYDELSSIWDYSYTTMNEAKERKKTPTDSNEKDKEKKEREREKSSNISLDDDNGGSSNSIFMEQSRMDMQAGLGGPMAGLGYGLPMSRVYAQFFGGDLDLVSLYGHGCDVFLRLHHLGDLGGKRI